MNDVLKVGIAGNKDALNRIEPWLGIALQKFLPSRRISIAAHDPFPPGQNNTEMVTLLREGSSGLAPMHCLHHRAGTIARVMLERNRDVDVMLRVDSGPLQMSIPKPTNVFFDGQFAVVAMLATRLKGAGAIMLYSSMHTEGYLGTSGLGHRQESKMSETAIQGLLPRWWIEHTRGAHLKRFADAA